MIRRGLYLATALALSGCARELPAVSGRCQLNLVAVLPMTAGPQVIIDGAINRKPARLLINTSAEVSSVAASSAAKYGVRAGGAGQATINGAGGRIQVPRATASIQLGSEQTSRSVTIIDFARNRDPNEPYDAEVGIDILARFDVEIAPVDQVVRLWRTDACADRYAPWSGRYGVVHLERTMTGALRVPVTLDGVSLRGVIDTGSGRSIVPRAAAAIMGVTDADLARDRRALAQGVDGAVFPIYAHTFRALALGPETIVRPTFMIAEQGRSAAEMRLGLDWFKDRRVWLSWSTRQMFVQTPDAIPVSAIGLPAAP